MNKIRFQTILKDINKASISFIKNHKDQNLS